MLEGELGRVEMKAVAEEQGGEDQGDHGDGGGFDPEHEAGGGLDVAVGEVGGGGGGEDRQDGAGDAGGQKDVGVVEEAADDG